jgi:Replication protein
MAVNDGQVDPLTSSLVPTHEINGFEPIDSARDYQPSIYERFRHGSWQSLRKMTFEVLEESGASEATLRRFAECGSCCQVSYSPEKRRLFLSSSNCKNRHCKPCAAAKRSVIANNLTAFAGKKHLRMILLTIAHHNRPLPELLTRINSSFKLLRKEKQWQDHVTGFAAFTEVKWSSRSDWWHVHIHILAEGTWWDRRELQATWHAVTGDSYVTDIREVTSEEGISYTAKYASKPFSLADIPANERVNAVNGIGRRRLWQVGGSWKGKVDLLDTPKLPDDVVPVGSFTDVVNEARRGNESAKAIIEAIVGGAAEEMSTPDNQDFEFG